MPKYKYKVQDKSGKTSEATIEATDRFDVYKQVRKEGQTVVSVTEIGSGNSLASWMDMERINAAIGNVKQQEVIMFSRNLSAMLDAGLVISRGLEIMKKQTKNAKLRQILDDMVGEVKKGETFAAALKKHPKVFSPLFVSMVRAGEESGSLAKSLKTIGDQMDKTYLLKKKVKGAMMYPAIVITAMIIIAVLMMMFVVPTLTETFESLGGELPASTQFIIMLSDFMSENTFTFLLSIVITIVFFIWGLRTTKGKRAFEWTILRIPVISTLVRETNAARTARTFSSLLASGVDIIGALDITHDVVQNSYFKEVLKEVKVQVEKGNPVSKTFIANEHLYPVLFAEMIAVGEETGKLSGMMEEVAMFYEREVDQKTKDLSTIIEPILMVTIGGGVGFFAVSMIAPIYSISDAI